MASVTELFQGLIPFRAKRTPSGWTTFNAPCCLPRGYTADKRKRGGVKFDNGIAYHCFNCGYTTGWKPGSVIPERLKSLMYWMGASDDIIKQAVFAALKSKPGNVNEQPVETAIKFAHKSLPDTSRPISSWLNSPRVDLYIKELTPILEYLVSRGVDPLNENYYWSRDPGFVSRVLIPFRYNGQVVGYTARSAVGAKPKYIAHQPPNYVFNYDAQFDYQKYLFVTEGAFDALAVNGVAVLHNEVSNIQARLINSIQAEQVIVIPDQDLAGTKLFDAAIEYNWSVASPNWDSDVKDCAQAVQRYGKLFVAIDAIQTAESGAIKINMAKKRLINRSKNSE